MSCTLLPPHCVPTSLVYPFLSAKAPATNPAWNILDYGSCTLWEELGLHPTPTPCGLHTWGPLLSATCSCCSLCLQQWGLLHP
jgi:hypothetical protein